MLHNSLWWHGSWHKSWVISIPVSTFVMSSKSHLNDIRRNFHRLFTSSVCPDDRRCGNSLHLSQDLKKGHLTALLKKSSLKLKFRPATLCIVLFHITKIPNSNSVFFCYRLVSSSIDLPLSFCSYSFHLPLIPSIYVWRFFITTTSLRSVSSKSYSPAKTPLEPQLWFEKKGMRTIVGLRSADSDSNERNYTSMGKLPPEPSFEAVECRNVAVNHCRNHIQSYAVTNSGKEELN